LEDAHTFYAKKILTSKEFLKFFTLISLFFIIVFFTFCIFTLFSFIEGLKEKSILEAYRIERNLMEDLSQTSRLMSFLGKKIESHDSKNLESIVAFLKEANVFKVKSMSGEEEIAYFDWINYAGLLVATGKTGILLDPPDVSYRPYFKKCRKLPWLLHVSPPDQSVYQNTRILPVGLGVTDDAGNFLGLISAGLKVSHLADLIEKVLESPYTRFLILQEDSIVIMSSERAETLSKEDFLLSEKLLVNKTLLDFTISFFQNHTLYAYEKKMSQFPYRILTGITTEGAKEELIRQIFPYFLGFLIMATGCIFVFFYFRKKHMLEIYKLTQNILNTNGKEPCMRPISHHPSEMSQLIEAFQLIQRKLQKQEREKHKLEELSKAIRLSYQMKNDFLCQFYSHTRASLYYMEECSSILLNSFQEELGIKLDFQKQKILLKEIHNTASDMVFAKIKKLEFSDVDTNAAIKNCILIKTQTAFFKGITIKEKLYSDLPFFCTDEFRFKQIILGLLSLSLESTPQGGKICISTTLKEEHGQHSLIITLKDNGFGLDQEDLIRLETNFREGESIFLPNFEALKKIIEICHGKLSIEATWGEGKKITLAFPFKKTKQTRQEKGEAKEEEGLPPNVYLFPQKKR